MVEKGMIRAQSDSELPARRSTDAGPPDSPLLSIFKTRAPVKHHWKARA